MRSYSGLSQNLHGCSIMDPERHASESRPGGRIKTSEHIETFFSDTTGGMGVVELDAHPVLRMLSAVPDRLPIAPETPGLSNQS